jgi:hypothetical protein
MKKLILLSIAFLMLFSCSNMQTDVEKIYGKWESQYSDSEQSDGFVVKVFEEVNIEYLRGDKINVEGTLLFEYDWNDEEVQTLLGSRFKISYFGYGSWSVDEEFLITTLENINPTIDDEYGIEYINSDELDESEKLRMGLYTELIGSLKNMQGISDEAEIITLKKDVMVLKSDNDLVTYTKVNN